LAEKLIDVYGDMVQIMESNRALREEIQELKRQAEIEHELEFNPNNGSYMRTISGAKEGPFCATCWDIDRKLVRMTMGGGIDGSGYFFCDWCTNRRTRRQ